jgi:monooxygenase
VTEKLVDILIVGAGLAGIGTACHVTKAFPGRSIAILERRAAIGGTWDLFRYPGVRSDTDMFSYGYAFRPWRGPRTLADGDTIREYIADTARAFHVDDCIRYGVRVTTAAWSSATQRWSVTVIDEATGGTERFRCGFLIACTGYYDHDAGYLPTFPGEDTFVGQRIRPQHWPGQLDYAGKRVVVIGSGATAITLVPAMADAASHITLLQRSPSYIVSMPSVDRLSRLLDRVLPEAWVHRLARGRFIALQRGVYLASKRWPGAMRTLLLAHVKSRVGKHVDMKHFTPTYGPWDQRVCVVPDGDLFDALKSGKASIVTGDIASFTPQGIRLSSGEEIAADIIVTATGLNVSQLGGVALSVDGEPVPLQERMIYKGVLIEGVPNLGWVFGHANAPWTLKVELAARYLCRLIEHMGSIGASEVRPRDEPASRTNESILDALASGYVKRANGALPRQGSRHPWKLTQHLGRDREILLRQAIDDPLLVFRGPDAIAIPRTFRGRHDGQIAVVTGAGSGIGRAIARLLSAEGARVHCADIDGAAASATVAGLDDARAHTLDVTDAAAVAALADAIYAEDGRVDLLFNNAGIGHAARVEDSSLHDWQRVLAVNLMGVVHGIHAFLPRMQQQAGLSRIVNTASGAGLFPHPRMAPYCASKHAVVGLSTSLAAELHGSAVGVTILCPGVIDTAIAATTRMSGETLAHQSDAVAYYARHGAAPEKVAADVLAAVRRRRLFCLTPWTQTGIGWLLYRLSPRLAMRIMRAQVNRILGLPTAHRAPPPENLHVDPDEPARAHLHRERG